MATRRRRIALVSALVLVFGVVVTAADVVRELRVWKGKPHVVERTGKCHLGAWSRATEEDYREHIIVRAGALAPQSCAPVEIKIEVTLWHWGKQYELSAMGGSKNTKLGRWKVVQLAGPQKLKRASVQAELDLSKVWGLLEWGDFLRVRVTVRCKHGTTVESDTFYWY